MRTVGLRFVNLNAVMSYQRKIRIFPLLVCNIFIFLMVTALETNCYFLYTSGLKLWCMGKTERYIGRVSRHDLRRRGTFLY